MSERPQSVQDAFLNYLTKNKVAVTVFLMNGIKLQGFIDGFDKFSVVLRRERHSQLVFKHTIATIVPMSAVQLGGGDRPPQQTQRRM